MRIFDLENGFKLLILDKSMDNDIINEYKGIIFEILKTSYDKLNGCSIYRSVNHMYKSVARYKLVIKNKEVYASATYNFIKFKESYKCTLIGGNKKINKDEVNESVKYIIKSDIANFKKLYWIEASGPIKKWEERFGAYKIPSSYVGEILNKKVEIIDEYRYLREIGDVDEVVEKTMFGFDSIETFNKFLSGSKINEYEEYLERLFDGTSLYEHKFIDKPKKIRLFALIDFIIQEYEESNQYRNVTEKTYKIMKDVYNELNEIIKAKTFDEKNKLDYFDWIIKNANIMKLHRYF